ncbi:hypothetical protein HCH_05291 [Hahella chejuensis KCTC 2396]|uniref:Uncharacterized protein n=1 Tax=Hahella chejuensis (strain KCTC 2396) TaxID=349521 RepID=Q2SBK9_HAHCH|nr:hypothetical protein [Hahella chejuensis]ABC31965.1 hypothetical protein HCH_05291 [Hahella chejuensis KCTC 2396]
MELPMSLRELKKISGLLLLASVLSACGGGDESLDGAGGYTPPKNDNKVDPPAGDASGETPPDPIDARQVNVAVLATPGMQEATVAQKILNAFLPASAYAISAGDKVAANLSVQQLDYRGNVISGGVISSNDYSVNRSSDGSYTITFDGSIPQRIDLVIAAELSNGSVIRTGLPNANKGILITAASEYAVRDFFSSLSSQAELDGMMPCNDGGDSCGSQAAARMLNWAALMNGVQDFEVTLPDNADLEETMAFLGDNELFDDFVDQFIATIRETKIDGATSTSIAPVLENRAGLYNSVLFAAGLNQGLPNGSPTVVFSNRIATIKTNTSAEVTTYSYPIASFTATVLGIINNIIVEQVPWERHSLTQVSDDVFNPGAQAEEDDINAHVGSTLTYLSPSGFFDMARLQTQFITREDSVSPTGWLTNPFYTRLYTTKSTNDDSTSSPSMASAYLSDGFAIELAAKSTGGYSRELTLEKLNTFGWLFHSRQSSDFSTSVIDGGDYGVISLRQKLDTDPVMSVTGTIHHWQATSSNIAQTQPAPVAGDPDIYHTYQMSRSADGSASGVGVSTETPESLALERLPTIKYNNDDKAYETQYTGRIKAGAATGVSDPSGNVLSFNIDSETEGQGIIHAVRLSDTDINYTGASYVLYGNSFGISAGATVFGNHNLSTLTFDDASVATLHLNERRVTQTIGSQTLSDIENHDGDYSLTPQASPAANTGADRNLLKLDFTDPQPAGGETLTMEGFAASGGNLLVLLVRYGDRIGLVYGFKQQALTANSD